MVKPRGSNTAGSVSHFSSQDDVSANLSSKQVWDMLTHLLYLTMRPLADQTTLSDDLVFLILASSTDQRRKVSAFDSTICFDYCYRLLFKSPDTAIIGLLNGLGVERTVFSEIIRDYLEGGYQPIRMHTPDNIPHYADEQLRAHVSDYFDLYLEFRSMVTNRFKKLSMSQAAKNKWSRDQFGLPSDLSDNEQNFYLAVIRAVDKFYPNRGTIANYVMLWLQNAAGSVYTLYTGEAFNLTRPVRKLIHDGSINVNNKSQSLDKASDIESTLPHGMSGFEAQSHVDLIARLQTHKGYAIVMTLYGYPPIPTASMWKQVEVMSGTRVSQPRISLSDLPQLKTPSRSPRRDSPDQQRRRDAIKNRRSPRKAKTCQP